VGLRNKMKLRALVNPGLLGAVVLSFLICCALTLSGPVSRCFAGGGQTDLTSLMLAQVEEGDIDQSFEAYGDDSDEIFEDDETMAVNTDSLLEGITWLGHASFLIEDGPVIYIDPYDIPDSLADSLPKADIVLVTHDHGDHFSAKDIVKIIKPSAVVVSIEPVIRDLPDAVKISRTVAPGDTLTVDGVFITAVPAYNIGKDYHPRDKGYVGYVINLGDKIVYHAGDTDIIPEMKNIDADVALLPIGGKFTMDAREAAEAAGIIGPKVAVPMHWGKIIGTWEDAKDFQARSKIPVVVLTAPGGPPEQ
jgi:L-ascorbate metabolism protein UlaG (beta-lactamase superfamily)